MLFLLHTGGIHFSTRLCTMPYNTKKKPNSKDLKLWWTCKPQLVSPASQVLTWKNTTYIAWLRRTSFNEHPQNTVAESGQSFVFNDKCSQQISGYCLQLISTTCRDFYFSWWFLECMILYTACVITCTEYKKCKECFMSTVYLDLKACIFLFFNTRRTLHILSCIFTK